MSPTKGHLRRLLRNVYIIHRTRIANSVGEGSDVLVRPLLVGYTWKRGRWSGKKKKTWPNNIIIIRLYGGGEGANKKSAIVLRFVELSPVPFPDVLPVPLLLFYFLFFFRLSAMAFTITHSPVRPLRSPSGR